MTEYPARLRMQEAFDLRHARKTIADDLQRIVTARAACGLTDLPGG
jgi:hypothetical protein